MSNGIDFAGNGGADVSGKSGSGPSFASRGAKGPIQWAGNGDSDVGGTIADTTEKGEMPPSGGDVQFAGNGDSD